MAVLFTESLRGVHAPPFPIRTVSTQGSAAVQYNFQQDSYQVVKGLLGAVEKGEVALIGTDLDHVGTKVATVLAEKLREKGVKPVRFSLTSRGYAFVGRFYTEQEMKACREFDRMNIQVANYFRRKYPDAPTTSVSTAAVVRAVHEAPERFKVPTKGTNTASVVTKELLKGKSIKSALGKLQRLYLSGKVEYPRVDNDLITEKPFEVYAHKALTDYGYTDDTVSPFEDEELPFTPATAPVYLSLQRVVTPASLGVQVERALMPFEGRKIRPGWQAYVEDCLAVAREYENEYRRLLSALHPRSRKYKVKLPENPTKEWFEKLYTFQQQIERYLEEEKVKEERIREERLREKKLKEEERKRDFFSNSLKSDLPNLSDLDFTDFTI